MNVDFLLDAICFISQYLLLRCKATNFRTYTFNCYGLETGALLECWPVECKHYLPGSSLVGMQYLNTELLVESCPQGCQLIRLYDINTGRTAIAYENVQASKICEGPTGSILACDVKTGSLLHLTLNDTKFHERQRLPDVDVLNVHDLCYLNTKSTDLAILSFANTKQATGISLTTGDVIWTQDTVLTGVPVNPCLCCTQSGPIFLGNGNNVLVLNPLDGSHSETLLGDANLKGISTIICLNQRV